MSEITVVSRAVPSTEHVDPFAEARKAIALWLGGFRSEFTKSGYFGELRKFAAFGGLQVEQAVAAFLAMDETKAHAAVDAYRASLIERGLAPASINRAMAALSSFTKSARRHGSTKLRIEPKAMKAEGYRDTKGPGTDAIRNMIEAARLQRNPKKRARDVAVLMLLFGLGLRRGEVSELNIGDLDLPGERLAILGKGRGEKEWLTVPAQASVAIADWLALRGTDEPEAPLFVPISPAMDGERLSRKGVYVIVKSAGDRIGIRARPHGLRHSAITQALTSTNGDYRRVRSFSRHSDVSIVMRYDDKRTDGAGQIAASLAGLVA